MSEVQDPELLVKQLQNELEVKNQALYDCERQRKTAETLVHEYQEEVRILQNEAVVENQKLEAKIQQLEESSLNLKVTNNERINFLEKELLSKDEEIRGLKLDNATKLSIPQEPVQDDALIEEIESLKEQNSNLFDELDELTKLCENKENEITGLHDLNIQLKAELEDYKAVLICKKEELAEATVINQNLQDNYDCLKAEFDAIKSKPLDDQSRGNSLFAEVDDRRVQLQQHMNQMKTQYLDMKRERANHLKQIAALRNENSNLLTRWESEVKEQQDDDDMILQSYKNQINTLNELVKSYKRELNQSASKSDGSIKFVDKMLSSKNQEIEALREKLSRNSLNEIVLSHDLANARKEIRKYELNVLNLQNDIGLLKVEIERLKLLLTTKDTLSVKEEQVEESVVKIKCEPDEVKEIDLINKTDKENIENIIADKRVQFTEQTIDPRITDRSKYRRGFKVIESKPVHITSIPKMK